MEMKLKFEIFLLALLFILTGQIQVYAILMVFAIIHELGHLLVGKLLGFKPKSFAILPVGATISFKVTCDDYNKKVKKGNKLAIKKLIIAMAGPITNLIVIILFTIFNFELYGISRELIIYCNILILVFNLIPIYPLDGGRIVKNILHIIYGLQEAYRYSNIISNITIIMLTAISSIAILYFKNIAILIILGYLWWICIIENRKYKNKMKIYEIIRNEQKNEKRTYKVNLTP